jgi:hypothetical protein
MALFGWLLGLIYGPDEPLLTGIISGAFIGLLGLRPAKLALGLLLGAVLGALGRPFDSRRVRGSLRSQSPSRPRLGRPRTFAPRLHRGGQKRRRKHDDGDVQRMLTHPSSRLLDGVEHERGVGEERRPHDRVEDRGDRVPRLADAALLDRNRRDRQQRIRTHSPLGNFRRKSN